MTYVIDETEWEDMTEDCLGGQLDPEGCCYECGAPRSHHGSDATFTIPDRTFRAIAG